MLELATADRVEVLVLVDNVTDNVLTHARDCFPRLALHAVLGGLHLSGGNERVIQQTVAALAPFDLKTIAAAHCTGWRAVGALATAFGDAVAAVAVGKTYRF